MAALVSPVKLPLKVICAWCLIVITPGVLPVSHGICPLCFDRVVA